MSNDKYPTYALVAVAGIALAVWAGLSASTLLFLLVCPLMMFFMMRGMHGGQQNHAGQRGQQESGAPAHEAPNSAVVTEPSRMDGSHERIDHP